MRMLQVNVLKTEELTITYLQKQSSDDDDEG